MRKLTVLVASINAVGHVNACAGATSALLSRGHRVIFVLEKAFQGKLAALGFEEFIWTNPPKPTAAKMPDSKDEPNGQNGADSHEKPGERMAHFMLQAKIIGPFSPLEKMENMFKFFENEDNQAEFRRYNAALKEALAKFQPDVIYVDGSLLPAVYYSGVPWVKQISTTPLFFIVDNELPPGGSGLPSDDPTDWHLFDEVRKEMVVSAKFGDIVEQMGYDRYPNDEVMPNTQILTVHAYPEELNYEAIRRKGWFNLEVFNHNKSNKLVKLTKSVPEEFVNDTLDGQFSGKWVYLSMGSMGSVDLELMNRLLAILGSTKHKYIVSKGPRHAEYELPANMWGDRYLPQTKLVPHMDLVITHGGNNTTTEVFAEGKPMIVLPLFADQFDNAQRLQETGLGIRLDPYNFTEAQLLDSIDKLLNDGALNEKLSRAAKRIQESNRHVELSLKIEELIS